MSTSYREYIWVWESSDSHPVLSRSACMLGKGFRERAFIINISADTYWLSPVDSSVLGANPRLNLSLPAAR